MARAMATRCSCPPESWRGWWCMRSASPTMRRAVSTRRFRSLRERGVRSRGSSTLRKALRTGMRLWTWKTKPTWRARQPASWLRDSPARSVPPTDTVPAVGTSRPPSRLSSVVLPEPLGPMKATNSPAATSRSSPRRTWMSSSPRRYVLSRPRARMSVLTSETPVTLTIGNRWAHSTLTAVRRPMSTLTGSTSPGAQACRLRPGAGAP